MDVKTCSKCKKMKPVTEFHLRSKEEPWPKSACKECHRSRARQYWRENPISKEVQKEKNLRNSFGIGLEDYNRMLQQQDNCCAICGKNADNFPKSLAVDHDHTSGKIRGLLCMYCNTALGKFEDSKQNLLNALSYLERNENGNSSC
jgi:hypothetical protein